MFLMITFPQFSDNCCCSIIVAELSIKLPWLHISQRVLVPLNTRRPIRLTHQPLLVSCYGETVNSGETDHPLPLLPVKVKGGHPAGPVLFVPELVQLGQELFLNPHFPGSPHTLDAVDAVDVAAGPHLTILLVEAAAAAEEEAVLVLDGVEGKYWFMRGSEADAGVAPAALGVLTLTGTARLTSSHPGPQLWSDSLGLQFISGAWGGQELGLATLINYVAGEGGEGGQGGGDWGQEPLLSAGRSD